MVGSPRIFARKKRNGACNQVWRTNSCSSVTVSGRICERPTHISCAPGGADIQVVDFSQRQKVRRRLVGSIPDRMSVVFLLTVAKTKRSTRERSFAWRRKG